ncbi:MAG: dTDP-4-dehydrorhamnose 3,5-epimerase [Ignavibacteria bacterium]|nr:dTDP-4-dehydrorhamnose 3,5-epimerase [Ignavibacteria bacterium]
MKFIKTAIPDVVIIEPTVFEDERGYFFESFRQDLFEKEIGKIVFLQENESKSSYGALRGLHYQLPPFAQSKLVRVIRGAVLDVVVDLRRSSPNFGRQVAIELSAENKIQLLIPAGFAHGFLSLEENSIFHYKVDKPFHKQSEAGIIFNDPNLNINWKINSEKILVSDKDKRLPVFRDAVLFE